MIHALSEAAELEHGLLLQYLYAAYSFKRRPDEGLSWRQLETLRAWEASLLVVAREEMAHLGTVCNLMSAIGAAPHFRRPNFPVANRYFPTEESAGEGTSFLLFALEPFGARTIDRFVRFEAPEPERLEAARFVEPALQWPTVGDLYGQVEQAFRELDEETLFIGPDSAQDSDDWTANLGIGKVVDRASAVEAIQSIVKEGEGPTAGSHWRRFVAIQGELREAQTADASFSPARSVVANPVTRPHFESPPVAPITDARTAELCELLNAVYETVVLLLMQYFAFSTETPAQRSDLQAIIRRLMSGFVRPLAEVLTELPAGPENPGQTAGASFELYTDLRVPARARSSWIIFQERLRDQARACERLSQQPEAPPRLTPLAENLHLAAATIEPHIPELGD